MGSVNERTPNADTPGQGPDTRHPRTGTRARAVSGKATNRLSAAFYAVVLAVAWAGQTLAAVNWLGVHWAIAGAAVSALELGGITLAARADYRRRLNESALGARLLSAGVAAFAVVFNWLGHHEDRRQALFFAGMSALGYLVWLINAGDRRRDQLRAEGKLPPPPPSYEKWQWLRHPLVTWRARGLAKADPTLGTYGSLRAAGQAVQVERRTTSISKVLHRKIRSAVDARTADIAVSVYDLDEVATRLKANADYDHLTALIAADLSPDRLTGQAPAKSPDTDQKSSADTSPDSDAEVVDLRDAGRRRRTSTDTRKTTSANSGAAPTVQDLADTLTTVHKTDYVGTPTALKTLRAKYRTCSKERAIEAKEIHNARREKAQGGESADDQKEESRGHLVAAGA
jgi:hypothetical protein